MFDTFSTWRYSNYYSTFIITRFIEHFAYAVYNIGMLMQKSNLLVRQ